jgi:hypothetical protein
MSAFSVAQASRLCRRRLNVHEPQASHPRGEKIPPSPLFQRGVLKSPFSKGGFRGILGFTVKPAATKFSPVNISFSSIPYV